MPKAEKKDSWGVSIFSLKLHEWVEIEGYKIIRVPGGWLYENMFGGTISIVVFVPYNNGVL